MSKGRYDHPEAFCLMNYQCEECGHREVLWNSRDGVTPFVIPCGKCGEASQHVDWSLDKYAPFAIAVIPDDQRVFTDITKERAVEFATRRMLSFVDHPEYPAPSKDSEKWNQLIATLSEDFYREGKAPDIITAKELKSR